jgi:hypothetical protein
MGKTPLNWIIIVFLFCQLLSCRNNDGNKEVFKPQEINIGKWLEIPQEIKISDIASNIDYIQLETSDSCLIGRISKIILAKNLLLILDSRTSTILQFTLEGRFVRKINKKGRGPGEYNVISDFTYLPVDSSICITDEMESNFIKYSLDGAFILKKKFPMNPDKITAFNDSLLSFKVDFPNFYYNNNFCVTITDKDLNVISKLLDHSYQKVTLHEADYLPTHSRTMLEKVSGTLTTWECGYDTIWIIPNTNTILAKYFLNYSNRLPTDQKHINKHSSEFNEIDEVIETQKYFFLNGSYKGEYFQFIYFKEKKKGSRINSIYKGNDNYFLLNDFDGGAPFFPQGIVDENRIFATISLFTLKSQLNEYPYNKINSISRSKRKELLKLVATSKYMDNPCLMIVTLK